MSLPGGILEGLSEAQREAVTHDGGPLIVLAGPGSGKTFVLIRRVAWTIAERGVAPETIRALTFTNKAARQLQEKLSDMPGVGWQAAERVRAGTFHAFAASLLARFGDLLGLPAALQIVDSAQRRRLSREIVRDRGLFRASLGQGVDAAIERAWKMLDTIRNTGMDLDIAAARLDERAEKLDQVAAPDDAWSEAVRLQYSPDAVSLDELLRVHLRTHSSTSAHAMRIKYRSAVYTTSPQQAEAVTAALQRLQGEFDAPLVTRVLPLVAFRPSEARYRDYYQRRPDRPFCQTYIRPKLDTVDALLGE